MKNLGKEHESMWDEEDGFFYDILRLPDGSATRLKVRSLVGLLPLCAPLCFHGEVRISTCPSVVANARPDSVERHPRLAGSSVSRIPAKDGSAELGYWT